MVMNYPGVADTLQSHLANAFAAGIVLLAETDFERAKRILLAGVVDLVITIPRPSWEPVRLTRIMMKDSGLSMIPLIIAEPDWRINLANEITSALGVSGQTYS